MFFSSLLSDWHFWVFVVAIALILTLILAANVALACANFLQGFLLGLRRMLQESTRTLQEQWARTDILELHKEQKIAELHARKAELQQAPTQAEIDAIKPEKRINSFDLTMSWTLRFAYIILFVVLSAAEFSLVAPRVAVLVNESLPAFMNVANKYLSLITSLLFICVMILTGMLVADYGFNLPDSWRLNPRLSPAQRKFFLYMSIAMGAIGFTSIIILSIYGGLYSSNGGSNLDGFFLVVLIFASMLIALSTFLGWEGFISGVSFFLNVSRVIVAFLLLVLLSVPLLLLWAIFAGMDRLGIFIRSLLQRKYHLPVTNISKDFSVVGYGSDACKLATNLVRQLVALYGHRLLWMIGLYSEDNVAYEQYHREILEPSIHDFDISIDSNTQDPAKHMIGNMLRQVSTAVGKKHNTFVWIVSDEDINEVYTELRSLQEDASDKLRIVLVWLLTNAYKPDTVMVKNLLNWFKVKDSILLTTLIIDERGGLWKKAGDLSDAIIARSLAGFLGVSFRDARNGSFEARMNRLRQDQRPFAGLGCGVVGVPAAIIHGAALVNGAFASRRLNRLGEFVLQEQVLSTVTDKYETLQHGLWVNIIAPANAIQEKLPAKITSWLQKDYSIGSAQFTLVESRPRDVGVIIGPEFDDLNLGVTAAEGNYYFHFSTIFGIGDGEAKLSHRIPARLRDFERLEEDDIDKMWELENPATE